MKKTIVAFAALVALIGVPLFAAALTFSNGTVGTYQVPDANGDFGRDAFGWLEARTEQPGTYTLHLGEQVDAKGAVVIHPAGSIRGCAVTCDVGRDWTRIPVVPDRRNTTGRNGKAFAIPLPPDVGVVLPFRYAQRATGPGAVEFRRVAVHWPMKAKVKLKSADADLQRLWRFCQHSMAATSFAGLMVDGDRERIPYEGDIYINMLGQLYGMDGDPELARRSIRHVLKYPTWPLEWRQHAIFCVWEDWHFTHDTTFAAETYDPLKNEKLLHESGEATSSSLQENGEATSSSLQENGEATSSSLQENLVMSLEGCLVDWPAGERDGYDMSAKGNTVVNSFHYRNLHEMADLATALGKSADAASFRARAEKVRAAINARLFDATRGLYVDGLGSTHASLHANVAALASDVVPPERRGKVLDFIVSRGMVCSPYFAQHYLEALCRYGRKDAALKLMKAKGDRSWFGMMEQGSTITTEAWSLKAKPNEDWNHAWGAAPLNILARYFNK